MFEFKKYIHIKAYIFLICMTAVFISCSPRPNTRWFIKGNAKFWGNLNIKGNRIYNVLEIGDQKNFYNKEQFKFSLKCDENNIINSENIDVDDLKSIADRIVDPNKYDNIWPANSELIYINGCSFVVNENDVLNVQVEVRGNSKFAPIIGDISENRFFTFPLSEEQIIELFGKPDTTKEFFRH